MSSSKILIFTNWQMNVPMNFRCLAGLMDKADQKAEDSSPVIHSAADPMSAEPEPEPDFLIDEAPSTAQADLLVPAESALAPASASVSHIERAQGEAGSGAAAVEKTEAEAHAPAAAGKTEAGAHALATAVVKTEAGGHAPAQKRRRGNGNGVKVEAGGQPAVKEEPE